MTDLAYLQDKAWIAEREEKWKVYSNRYFFDVPEKESQFARSYFFDGDIRHLMTDEYQSTLTDVISTSPINDTSVVIESISKYWFWVLEKPDSRDRYENTPDIEERFLYHFNSVFSPKGDYSHPDVCIGLFHWLYGDSYKSDRVRTLTHQGKTVVIPVKIDVDALTNSLMYGIIDYLWTKEDDENICIFKDFIQYFLSIFPYMSPICYDTRLPRAKSLDGSVNNRKLRKCCLANRWFLTTLNGFISEYEEEAGIEELKCNDDEAFAQLKEGLSNLKMPEEFYRLQEFVLKHEGDSLYASEIS